jgi:hypothetical protein
MLFCTSNFIIAMPIAYFQSDYWSKKILKLKYSIKIVGDLLESKGTTASSIPAVTMLILNQW